MAAEANGRAMTRMLIAIFEGDEGRSIVQLTRLVGLSRLQNASVRVAYFRRIPRDRTDRYDRVVSDRFREMLRIEEAMREAVAGVLRATERARVECVVRFGSPVVEVEREAEAFAADSVAFAPGPGLRARWRSWRGRPPLPGPPPRPLVLRGARGARLPAGGAPRPPSAGPAASPPPPSPRGPAAAQRGGGR